MRPVSAAFAAAVTAPHTRAARVALLDEDLATTAYLEGVMDGDVDMAADRRRTCSFSVVDTDGSRVPVSAADALFPNRVVRLDRGIVVGGAPEWVSLGVFIIDCPQITVTAAATVIRVSGQDRLKLVVRSKFTRPVRYDGGSAVGEVIRAIAVDAGLGETRYRINDAGRTLGADRTYDTGDGRLDAMRLLAADFALETFVDADGYLVVAPVSTATELGDPVFTFERGASAIMTGITRDFGDDRLYNHVLVSGEAADLPPVRAEARDLNPASPAYNPPDGSGPIGDRLYEYTSAMIRTVEQAQAVADALLVSVALIEESITIPSAVHPALEAGDVVSVIEPASRTSDRYVIDTVSMPLGAGGMTVTSRKVRSLS